MLLETLDVGHGEHRSVAEGASIMEAVAYVAGEPWSSTPECASPTVGAFLRAWLDALGPDGDATRQAFKPFIVLLIGSHGGPEAEDARQRMAVEWYVGTYLPTWLSVAGLADETFRFCCRHDPGEALNSASVTGAVEAARSAVRAEMQAVEASAPPQDGLHACSWWPGAQAGVLAAVRDAMRAAAGTAVPAAWFPSLTLGAGAVVAARDAAYVFASRVLDGFADRRRGSAAAAAWGAARDVLWPTVIQLQASAHSLVHRMLAAHETPPGVPLAPRWPAQRPPLEINLTVPPG